jgi:hypothetical protein
MYAFPRRFLVKSVFQWLFLTSITVLFFSSCSSSTIACRDSWDNFEAQVIENWYPLRLLGKDHYSVQFRPQPSQAWKEVFVTPRQDSDPGICDGINLYLNKKRMTLELTFNSISATSKDLGVSWQVNP